LDRSVYDLHSLIIDPTNIQRFQDAFKDFLTIHVPAAITEFCTETVMVQELSGSRLVNTPSVREEGTQLATHFSDAYLHQFFVMRYFHADPHPGNLFIMDNGKICFQDYAHSPLKDWSIATALLSAVSMGWGSQLRMPHHLLVLVHALLTMEATLRNLDPEFNMIEYWQDKGRALMTTALKEQLETSGARFQYEAAALAQEIPKALVQLMRQTRTGKFEIPLHHNGLRDFENHIDRSSNRIALALVALGLYIASSLLMQSRLGPLISGMPMIALGGYALALWVTFRLLQGISRSGRA